MSIWIPNLFIALVCNRSFFNVMPVCVDMKRYAIIGALALTCTLTVLPTTRSHAIVWVVVTAAIKKAIKAMDLQIQRLQNNTIRLQNAQKALENFLSKLKLEEISEWTDKQKKLFSGFYEELSKVKTIITSFRHVREITNRQLALVAEYQRAFNLLRQDRHFSAREIEAMQRVYGGMISQSVCNLDEVLLAVNSFATQMGDAQRLKILSGAAEQISVTLGDLRTYTQRNIQLSVLRSRDEQEAGIIRQMYGIK